jgi:hypothetical protein
MILETWSKILYSIEQGIISAEQGILAQEQGFLPFKTEIIAGWGSRYAQTLIYAVACGFRCNVSLPHMRTK